MRIGVIGPGRIGGNCARQALKAGHEVTLSFSRDARRLEALAEELGANARAGTPAEAVQSGDAIVLAVPWDAIDEALGQAGSLDAKILIDTTNQYGQSAMPPEGQTAAQFNAARMPGARYTKSFNTLTSAFQAEAADRKGDERVVQWICGDVDESAAIAAIRQALDLGINFFDTAQAYGFGVSERILGRALADELRSRRAELVIATKGGLSMEGGELHRDASPAFVRRGLEESLENMGIEYIDLFQMHWPDPSTPFAETAEALGALVDEGKIRHI